MHLFNPQNIYFPINCTISGSIHSSSYVSFTGGWVGWLIGFRVLKCQALRIPSRLEK